MTLVARRSKIQGVCCDSVGVVVNAGVRVCDEMDVVWDCDRLPERLPG